MANPQNAILTNLTKYQWYTHLSRSEGADLTVIKSALRDLRRPAQRALTLAPRAGSILRYRVRAEQGTVTFSDTSRAQPAVFSRLVAFVREVAQGVCGLSR